MLLPVPTLIIFFASFGVFSAEDSALNLEGVDPNSLSCDPAGHIFLLLPHFTSCHKFYMCAHGNEVEFTCPGDLMFNFVKQVCDWPRDTECILRSEPDDIDGSGDEEFAQLMGEVSEGAETILTADRVANSVRPQSIEAPARTLNFNTPLNCLRADSASKHVAYRGDCQRYWRCINGLPQSAYCTDGLYFNERTEQCDFEANVKCTVEQEDELASEFILYK
ncbi:unnamed protein product, partial [Brenthis ino]